MAFSREEELENFSEEAVALSQRRQLRLANGPEEASLAWEAHGGEQVLRGFVQEHPGRNDN